MYNGRFTHDRAVAAAAQAEGVRVLYYDTGGYDTDFDLTEATTHDWAHLQGRMLRMYDDVGSGRARRHRLLMVHRTGSRTRTTTTGCSSVHQTRGHIEGLPEAEHVVAFFSSSGDEIAELDLDWADYLHSQEAALAATCRSRAGNGPGTALVVRTHPHMRLKPAARPRGLDGCRGAGGTRRALRPALARRTPTP